jgi:hypothetical protein
MYKSEQSKIFHYVTFVTICIILNSSILPANGQGKTKFGVIAEPAVCWFSSDVSSVRNDGARPGFTFGLAVNRHFAPNYSFSTGIGIQKSGGRLTSSETTIMDFTNFSTSVPPGEAMIYRIQYLAIPLGIKMQTNQIGYITIFTDMGLDAKFLIGGKCDIPSQSIEGEKASTELNPYNIAYHITAGIEYSLGGATALLLGLKFENNFLDVTEDNGAQPKDKIMQKVLGIRLGLNF